MATGIASPPQVTPNGGAVTVRGSALTRQLLLTALRDCSSDNPFQKLGVGDENIFDINDQQTVARLKAVIQVIFARFEAQQLARLAMGEKSLEFAHDEEGALSVRISYVDLETDKPETVSLTHNANGWR